MRRVALAVSDMQAGLDGPLGANAGLLKVATLALRLVYLIGWVEDDGTQGVDGQHDFRERRFPMDHADRLRCGGTTEVFVAPDDDPVPGWAAGARPFRRLLVGHVHQLDGVVAETQRRAWVRGRHRRVSHRAPIDYTGRHLR